jgi:hypothetical protein
MQDLINAHELLKRKYCNICIVTFVNYFPTIEMDQVTLYHKFWDVVYHLSLFDFKVLMCVCDGAQANHTFIKYHFDGLNPVDDKYLFTTTNIYTGEPLIFMVDPSVSFFPLF